MKKSQKRTSKASSRARAPNWGLTKQLKCDNIKIPKEREERQMSINVEELKGFDKIDEIVNEFVEHFDCDAEFNDEFCYWHDDCTIGYNLIVGVESDLAWTEYVKETFDYSIKNIFVFSILHEVGHHFTMDDFSKTDLRKEFQKVEKIEAVLSESDDVETDRKLYKEYFDLPMERTATEWAVGYARKNPTTLRNFWKKLEKALKEFYSFNFEGEPSM